MGCENSCEKHPPRIVVLGMGNAGKTTIVCRLKNEEFMNTVPTYGFAHDEIKFDNITYDFWDLGGQDRVRPQWGPYYQGANGVIFVVDSQDHSLFNGAKQEIHKALQDKRLENVPFLVFANKQDIKGAFTRDQIIEQLSLENVINERYGDGKGSNKMAIMQDLNKSNDPLDPSRRCFVDECCALTNDGIEKGMRWLVSAIHYREDVS